MLLKNIPLTVTNTHNLTHASESASVHRRKCECKHTRTHTHTHTHTRAFIVRHMNNPIAGWLVKSLAVCRLYPWNLSLPAHKLSQNPEQHVKPPSRRLPPPLLIPKKHNYQLCLCLFTPLKLCRTRTKTPKMETGRFPRLLQVCLSVKSESVQLQSMKILRFWGKDELTTEGPNTQKCVFI